VPDAIKKLSENNGETLISTTLIPLRSATTDHRVVLWSFFERVRSALKAPGLVTYSGMFSRVAPKLRESAHPPFEFVVVDEARDVSVAQLRFLATLLAERPNILFFAGDLRQRIFQQPFSWKALGVDVRGRSSLLRINYRTLHQIRMQADRLLWALSWLGCPSSPTWHSSTRRGRAVSGSEGETPLTV